MEMRTLNEIDRDIAETKDQLNHVEGTQTEVYARIVGYYRAVRNWNKGKKQEFSERKMFETQEGKKEVDGGKITSSKKCATNEIVITKKAQDDDSTERVSESAPITLSTLHYEMFTRKTCPNCPAVKAFMGELDLHGVEIDVDTKAGLSLAASHGVFSSPTVIFYDAQDNEVSRFHSIDELERSFDKEHHTFSFLTDGAKNIKLVA